MVVGIVRDEIYLQHVTDEYHPENPNRLKSVYEMLDTLDQSDLRYVTARSATHEEIALVHDPSYIESIARTKGRAFQRLDPDTVTSARSYEAALKAVGGVLELVDAIQSSTVNNGFAFVRPPGHHAERSRGMGFCLFNNIAIAAKYLQEKYHLKSVLIVDFDIHHGNGTQNAFYTTRNVLYFSTHLYPYFPGSGWFEEIGGAEGRGYTVNVAMNHGMGDEDYLYAFSNILRPIAQMFVPEFILVSAGFDSYYNDPLGGMSVTEEGFGAMTRMIVDIAEQNCGGKVAFVLEGGYDLKGLASSTKSVIGELKKTPFFPYEKKGEPTTSIVQAANLLKRILLPYWGYF